MKKVMLGISAVLFGALIACSGVGGISEGEECGGTQDNCHNNLTCQPIQGRDKQYCCPTPASASNYDNCHAVTPTK